MLDAYGPQFPTSDAAGDGLSAFSSSEAPNSTSEGMLLMMEVLVSLGSDIHVY